MSYGVLLGVPLPFPNGHPRLIAHFSTPDQLLYELALDQAEFNQSLPELEALHFMDIPNHQF